MKAHEVYLKAAELVDSGRSNIMAAGCLDASESTHGRDVEFLADVFGDAYGDTLSREALSPPERVIALLFAHHIARSKAKP